MARKSTVSTLEHQIEEAQAALDAAPDTEKPAIEAQIAQKSADLDVLKNNQAVTYKSEAEELAALRQEKRDSEMARLADDMAAQAVAGIKSHHEQENDRISQMVQERVQAQVAELLGGTQFASAVKSTLGNVTYGRKTPMSVTEDQGERRVPNVKTGKGSFTSFLRAVAFKDSAGLQDVYRAHGMKALVEGGGAGSAGSLAAGGALVPPEYSTELIDLLRPAAVLRKAGAEIRTMTSPIYYQPRLATAATASYIGETVAIPPSQETFDQISLVAKKLAAMTVVSNELLRDSNPSVETTVRNDLVKVIALKEDAQFLNGTGSSTTPTGLFKQSGVQANTPGVNGDAMTYQTPLTMWYKGVSANLPMTRPAWFTNPVMIKMLLEVVDTNGRPIFTNYFDVQKSSIGNDTQLGFAGTLLGAPLYTTTQIPLGTTGTGITSSLALIDMSQVLIGQMADVYIDTSNEASYYDGTNTISLFQSDLTGFRAIIRHDITLMHSAAVILNSGIVYS